MIFLTSVEIVSYLNIWLFIKDVKSKEKTLQQNFLKKLYLV